MYSQFGKKKFGSTIKTGRKQGWVSSCLDKTRWGDLFLRSEAGETSFHRRVTNENFSCTGGIDIDSLGSMSAIASLASPSPPVKCGQFRTIFTVPQFAKWAQTPASTAQLPRFCCQAAAAGSPSRPDGASNSKLRHLHVRTPLPLAVRLFDESN